MGKVISVASFEDMERSAQKLQELSVIYNDIAKQLLQEANTMGSAWEGADNLAFVEQINGFTEELKMMSEKLDTAGRALHQQKQNYVDRQDFNIQQVKKLIN